MNTTAQKTKVATHTPGPWGYDGDGFDSIAAQHCDTDGYTVFPVDKENACSGSSICEISDTGDDDECIANARLVAAAPELLAALKQSQREIEHLLLKKYGEQFYFGDCQTWANNRAAIAKATTN